MQLTIEYDHNKENLGPEHLYQIYGIIIIFIFFFILLHYFILDLSHTYILNTSINKQTNIFQFFYQQNDRYQISSY